VTRRQRAARGRPGSAPRRAWRRPGVLALAGVFLVKLGVLLQLRDHPLLQPDAGLDTSVYLALAQEVVGGNLSLGPGLYFVSPLYIYFVALVLRVAGSVFWVRLVQIVLGTAAVWLIFRMADRWHGRRAAWIAGALAAGCGLFTFYEILLLQAALDPFLTALALALVNGGCPLKKGDSPLFAKTDTKKGAVPFSGLVFGVQTLNRPNVLIAAAGLAVILAVQRRWRAALLFAAGLVLALLPVALRNYIAAGDLAPVSSHGGLNFYIGNNADADGTYRMVEGITPSMAGQQEDARRVAERAIGRRLDDSEVSAYFYGQGWSWITQHPLAAAQLFSRKVAYLFNAAHLSLNYSFPYYVHDEHTLLRYLPVGPWLIVPFGLLGLWIGAPADPERRRAFYTWASFVPLYALSVAIFFVSSRYRLPLLVPLAVTAGGAIDALSAMAARARRSSALDTPPAAAGEPPADAVVHGRRRVILAIAALAGLAVIANWPFRLDEGRAEERTRMALWLVGQGRFDEADARIASLEPSHPQPGVLHFRAGRALLAKGQADSAVRHLERARAIDPDRAENDYALGQALLDARRPKDAIPHLRRALEANVRPDLVGYDLVRAHAASGDRLSALRVLQNVRPAERDDAESWRVLGELALDLEAPRLAEGFLRAALQVRNDVSQIHEQLGLAVALGGRYPEAIRSFEEAVRLDPSSASAQLNLGVAYAEVGRIQEARARAQESLRLNPSYDRARQFLAAIAGK
jgi:tetratricopeptide (TPR) repeat protein